MSRARVHEVSSPISLFPFIGILLCTMGALLVVLVAVSRSARDSAQRDLQAKHAKSAKLDPGMQKKMNEVQAYMGSLHQVRSAAEGKLREENTHLSQVEDHIRRLQEKMQSLQVAAAELEAVEKEHYDDREQAQRETTRLNQLIAESKKTIESLKNSTDSAPGSYAVVPYEGPNGTYRRPIYIECVKEGVILQPEGVHIDTADLRPPYGPGNPLASVIRASRDHLVKLNPKESARRDLEPYPLLLVRPEGLITFDRARQAIEAGDFDLGFELVENDWKLKFPQPDPQLAALQQETLVQARARQQILAAAAPRAYRSGSFGMGDRYGEDDDSAEELEASGGTGGYANGPGGRYANGTGSAAVGSGAATGMAASGAASSERPSTPISFNSGSGGGKYPSGGSGAAGPTGLDSAAIAGSGGNQAGSLGGGNITNGDASGGGGDASSEVAGGGGVAAGSAMVSAGDGSSLAGGSGGSPMAPPDPNAPPEMNQPQTVSMMYGSSPPDAAQNARENKRGKNEPSLADSRGKDWALRQKPQRATPVRRTIRVFVRDDQLAILPDGTTDPMAASRGKVVPLKGDTVECLDEFVKDVRDQIDGWGIAGNGLYWRPVILVTVAPQAQRRAEDLERLLRNSGLELRTDETASNAPSRKVQ